VETEQQLRSNSVQWLRDVERDTGQQRSTRRWARAVLERLEQQDRLLVRWLVFFETWDEDEPPPPDDHGLELCNATRALLEPQEED